MRHRVNTKKLGRSTAHRQAMLANMVCSLITEKRIRTTVAKAKLACRLAEKMVTLAKQGALSDRRRAIAVLRRPACVRVLFQDIAPQCKNRAGGYVRVLKLGNTRSDGAELAMLEWVDVAAPVKTRPKKKDAQEEGKKAV